jgi:hypothetical protein
LGGLVAQAGVEDKFRPRPYGGRRAALAERSGCATCRMNNCVASSKSCAVAKITPRLLVGTGAVVLS